MGVKRRPSTFVLKVNHILCDGFGHCAELAPELVNVDEWGYPIIRQEPTKINNAGAYESAKYAVRGCPRQALQIEKITDAQP